MSFLDRIRTAQLEGSDLSRYSDSLEEWNEALEEVRHRLMTASMQPRGDDRNRNLAEASSDANSLLPLLGVLRPHVSLRLRVNTFGAFDEDNENDRDYELTQFVKRTKACIQENSLIIALRPPCRVTTGTHGSGERNHLWQSCNSLSVVNRSFWKVHLLGGFLEVVPELITEVLPSRLEELCVVEDGSLWKEYLWERWNSCKTGLRGSPSVQEEVTTLVTSICGKDVI